MAVVMYIYPFKICFSFTLMNTYSKLSKFIHICNLLKEFKNAFTLFSIAPSSSFRGSLIQSFFFTCIFSLYTMKNLSIYLFILLWRILMHRKVERIAYQTPLCSPPRFNNLHFIHTDVIFFSVIWNWRADIVIL